MGQEYCESWTTLQCMGRNGSKKEHNMFTNFGQSNTKCWGAGG